MTRQKARTAMLAWCAVRHSGIELIPTQSTWYFHQHHCHNHYHHFHNHHHHHPEHGEHPELGDALVVGTPGHGEHSLVHRLLDTDLGTDTAVCEAALALCFTFLAASSASCLHLRSYRLLTGKKRGPKVPSLGPRSGLSPARPRKLMWSRTIIRSPTWQQVM